MTAGPVSKNLQKLFFYEEPSRAAFGVDHSGTLAEFTLVPHVEGSIDFDPGRVTLDPGHGVHHVFDWREKILGHKMWTLAFQVPFAPSGHATGGGDGQAAVPGPVAKLLKNVFGGIEIGTGTTVATTWSDGEGGALDSVIGLKPGMALLFVIAGRSYIREIKSITGSTIALKVALPAAPQENDVVYGGITIYLHSNPQAFAQFLVIGEEEDDRYIFRGGWGSVTLDLALSGEGVPMLSFEFEGRAWDYGKDGATNLATLPFLPEAYSNYNSIAAHEGEFIEQESGEPTLSTTAIKALSIEVALEKLAITNPASEEGLEYWRRIRANAPTVRGSFTPSFYDSLDRQTHRDNRDTMYLAHSFGTNNVSAGVPGSAVLITVSSAQYLASPPVESDGVGAETTEFEGRRDLDTVEATATDCGLSPARIHLFR